MLQPLAARSEDPAFRRWRLLAEEDVFGTYECCFVVDGQWIPDPPAKDYVANPFGGRDSVLRVPASPEAAHLADAKTFPLKDPNERECKEYEPRNSSSRR